MDKKILTAAWANIISVLISVAIIASVPNIMLDLVATVFGIVAMYGFYRIGQHEKSTLLKVSAALLILYSLGFVAMEAMTELPWDVQIATEPTPEEITQLGTAYTRLAVTFSIMGILVGLFSYSLLELRKRFGNLALWCGITGIIAGASLLLMFGVPVGAAILNISSEIPILAALTGTFIAFPAIAVNWILEIILLFKAAKKYK